MSELWRELIERESPALARGLSLSRVSISKSTGKMSVRLASGRILSGKEYKIIKNCLEQNFSLTCSNIVLPGQMLFQKIYGFTKLQP